MTRGQRQGRGAPRPRVLAAGAVAVLVSAVVGALAPPAHAEVVAPPGPGLRPVTHLARVTKGLAFVPKGIICFSGYPTDAIYIPR